MPRWPKKPARPANLSDLIRSQPIATEATDDQLRRMMMQLILDNPDYGINDPANQTKLMKVKLDTLKALFEMNHIGDKDKEDPLSAALVVALAGRK